MIHLLLAAVLLQPPPVSIDVWGAPWCPACRQQAPVVQRLQQAGHPLRAINFDDNREEAAKRNVTRIPTSILYVYGVEQRRAIGVQSEATFRAWLQSVRERQPE